MQLVGTAAGTRYKKIEPSGWSGTRIPAVTDEKKNKRRLEQKGIHRGNADERNKNHTKYVFKEHEYLSSAISKCHLHVDSCRNKGSTQQKNIDPLNDQLKKTEHMDMQLNLHIKRMQILMFQKW